MLGVCGLPNANFAMLHCSTFLEINSANGYLPMLTLSNETVGIDVFEPIPHGTSPLYQRIAALIGKTIQERNLAAGTKLPTEGQFAQHFGVSTITVRAALKELVALSVIERRQGRGTYIKRNEVTQPTLAEWSLGSVEDLILTSRLSETILLRAASKKAPKWALQLLTPITATRLFNVVILRRKGDTPILVTDAFYPPWVGEKLAHENIMANLKQSRLLIEMVEEYVGQKIMTIHQTMDAIAAPAAIAKLLEVRAGSPILMVTRIGAVASGTVMQVGRSYYRNKDFSYSVLLKRTPDRQDEPLPQQ